MKESNIINFFSKKNHTQLQGFVVGFIGELGAGKTALIKKIVTELNPELTNQVSSPTFSLCNYYSHGHLSIHHFDLYRIEREEELYQIELFDLINEQRSLIFIEWANLFNSVIGLCDCFIKIDVLEDNQREYSLKNHL